MEPKKTNTPIYKEHKGTLKIAGATSPKSAGHCAFMNFVNDVDTIDFFYIGGNAGQQAMKAMGVFAAMIEANTDNKMTAAFRPLRFMTPTKDEKGMEKLKDATVWRTVLMPLT